jgi:hypothetical protein
MPIPWVNDFINALPPFNFVYITKFEVHYALSKMEAIMHTLNVGIAFTISF